MSGMDLQYLAIEDDAHGMKPDILRAALTQAVERGTNGVPKVRILYHVNKTSLDEVIICFSRCSIVKNNTCCTVLYSTCIQYLVIQYFISAQYIV